EIDGRVGAVLRLYLDNPVVERSTAKLFPQLLSRFLRRRFGVHLLSVAETFGIVQAGGREQNVEYRLFGVFLGPRQHLFIGGLLCHIDGDIRQLADHALDIAADIADLRKFRRLYLYKRRIGHSGQAAGDLCLADAGRADHQDIFWQDVAGDLVRELLPPYAIAKSDGHGAFRVPLPDDILVKLFHDLTRRQVIKFWNGGRDLSAKLNRHKTILYYLSGKFSIGGGGGEIRNQKSEIRIEKSEKAPRRGEVK